MIRTLPAFAIASLACFLLAGCHVNEHINGDNDNVRIDTPLGSMHVRTTDTTDTSAIGLTVYPGAVPVEKEDDDGQDSNSTNVNMSFGSFHLGVKAARFQTSDSLDKVLAFYRKDLAARYGDFIECRGNNSISSPNRTSEGLTCDTRNHPHIHIGTSSDHNIELRAGSEQHQHVVAVESRNGGTRIGLLALDHPSHLSGHKIE